MHLSKFISIACIKVKILHWMFLIDKEYISNKILLKKVVVYDKIMVVDYARKNKFPKKERIGIQQWKINLWK